MCTAEILSLVISGIALLFSIYSAYISYKTEQKQTQLSFFSEYTKRYQDIMLHLYSDDKNKSYYYRLYFDLCSEEFYLHERKYLPSDVWKMWEDGMKFEFKIKDVNTAWEANSQYYNDKFCEFIRKIINDSKTNNYNNK